MVFIVVFLVWLLAVLVAFGVRSFFGSWIPMAILGAFILVTVPIVYVLVARSTEREVVAIVNSKENHRDDGYLIFTDAGTFTVSDTIVYLRWNSSDVYGAIYEGKCYKLDVYGWRVPFLSMYPNVIEAEETSCD